MCCVSDQKSHWLLIFYQIQTESSALVCWTFPRTSPNVFSRLVSHYKHQTLQPEDTCHSLQTGSFLALVLHFSLLILTSSKPTHSTNCISRPSSMSLMAPVTGHFLLRFLPYIAFSLLNPGRSLLILIMLPHASAFSLDWALTAGVTHVHPYHHVPDRV